ncbi:NAD-dependent protein deacetylase of SIR2 family [hydrothermal vent metagenome]|uniref:NAD-dependent protein deacetylase of SIR2 family n=1 Tax=hydrothermal vent metagenome TaxID=652676 RepID=A0A1W1EFM1_9ZZZZ
MAKVIIFSGAGISAESGISTFRSSDGLWEEYDVNVVCNYDSLDKNEDITIDFYDKRRSELENKHPNYAHKLIAELKKKYSNEISIITQNVDNLFEKAGLKEEDVLHLHGSLTQLSCRQCKEIYDVGYKKLHEYNDGLCNSCGSKLRPNIVFFGEQAPMYENLNNEIQDCEFIVVIGTSGTVVGVNTMAAFIENSILNNLEPSDAIDDTLFKKVLYSKATESIAEIVEDIENFLKKS